ncbi:MAG: Ger(x)C family spore germination protein [Candidatus Pristimantibacillus sp.]
MLRMKRLISTALLAIGLSFILTSCWDRREINDYAFVQASSIDKAKDGIQVSVLIPLPGNMGSTGGGGNVGGQKPFVIKTDTGRDVIEAVNKLQSRLPRRLFFAHRRVLIVGEEVARNGLAPGMDSVTRLPENRLTAFIAVTKGSALDLLNSDTRLERFSAESMRESLQSDLSLRVTLKDVISESNVIGSDAMLPYLQKITTKIKGHESDEIAVVGYALTHNGKMISVAKDEAMFGIRILSHRFRPYQETFSDGNNFITVRINKEELKIKPIMKEGKLRYRITAKMSISVNEDTNLERNYDDIGQRRHIEKLVEEKMTREINKAITLMQSSNCDVIGFGQYAYRAYPQAWNKEWKDQWDTLFPASKFDINVRVTLNRIGMSRENLAKKAE